MSAKIADLRIGIKNTGESAVKDLQDLATALKTIDRAKNSLDFKDTANRSSQGLRQLEIVVQKLTSIMKPLAEQMDKINKGASALKSVGAKNIANASEKIKSSSTAKKVNTASTEKAETIPSKIAETTQRVAEATPATSVNDGNIQKIGIEADVARSKLSLLIERLNLLKAKYAELSADNGNAYQANVTARQIKTTEEQIIKQMQLTTANKNLEQTETLSVSAMEASSKIDILRQKLELLKQKYNELSADPLKRFQANSTAVRIKNLEATIQKLEEGKTASTGFAVGMKNVASSLSKVNVSSGLANTGIGRLVSSFGRLLKLKGLRMIVQEFYRSIGEGIKNLYEYSRAMDSLDSANFKNTMDGYSTSMQTLRNTIGATIGQVITSMLPTIQTLINYLSTAINVINQFFAALQGKTVFTKAKDSFKEYAEATSSSAGGATSAVKELQRTILAFDELNVLNSPDTSSGSGGGGGGASTPDYTDMFEEADINEKIKKVADKVKEVIDFIKENFDTIWAIVSNIGLALLAWKVATDVANLFSMLDKLGFTQNAGKIAFGITLSLVGFAIEATGAYDIGKNGANLRNIIQTALGGALGVLGGVIAFGAGSIIVTIPLALMVAFSGIKVGEGVAKLENDEEFQKWAQWVENAKEAQARVDEIIAGLESRTSELLNGISTNVATAQALRDKIFEIVDENGKLRPEFEDNEQAIENLKTLIEEFNKLSLSDIQVEYKDLSKEISLTKQEVNDLIDTYKKQAQTEAYLELYKEHYKAIIELQAEVSRREQEWNDAKKAQAEWEEDNLDRLNELQDRLWSEGVGFMLSSDYSEYVDLQAKFEELTDAVNSTEDAFKNADKALQDASDNADVYWDLYEQSVTGAIDTVTNEIDTVTNEIKKPYSAWNDSDFIQHKLEVADEVTPKINDIKYQYAGLSDAVDGISEELTVASQNMVDWADATFDWGSVMETAGEDASTAMAEVLDGTESNYEAYIKLKDYLANNPIHYQADEKAYEVLSTQFSDLLIEYANTATEIGETPFEFKSNRKQVSESLGEIIKEYDGGLLYLDQNWLEFKGDSDDVLNKVRAILECYTEVAEDVNSNALTPAVDDSLATKGFERISGKWDSTTLKEKAPAINPELAYKIMNEMVGTWNKKNFPAKSLTATNNVGTAVNSAYNTWKDKNFPSKGLSVSTGGVTDSMNYVQRYWKNLDMSKGISATVSMGGARVQFNGYAEGGFPDYGSIFIAGEAGAEMVGNINGRTGVASQGEITGIRQSVEATGNAEARLLAEQNALLRQILAKEGNVTISTSEVIKGLNRTNRRAGKTVVAMGQ